MAKRFFVIGGMIALFSLGIGVSILAAGLPSTGTVTACATAKTPAQTIKANALVVGTIPSKTNTQCVTTTYTIPTTTEVQTVTVTAPTDTTPVTTTQPPTSNEPAPIAGQGYSLKFDDEFNTLDRAVWDDHIWYDDPPNPNWAGFQSVENGVLHLRTSRNFIWSGASSCNGDQPDTCNWPINTVTTHTSGITFQQGYFEARINWTGANGSWPAFWLLSQGWANTGSCTTPAAELDVMEGQGSEPNVFYGTVHQDASGSGCKSDQQNANNYQPMGFRLADGWHTYSALWTATQVSWYIDDSLVMSAPTYSDFNQPLFLLLQTWVGGWTTDPNSSTPDTLDTQVDWVHVWQK